MKLFEHRPAEDTLSLLLSNSRLIGAATLTAGALSAALSLLSPNVFTSDARLLVPQEQPLSSALNGPQAALSALSGGMNPLKNPNDLYVGMLHSRNVLDGVLAKVKPSHAENMSSVDDLRDRLSGATKVTAGKDNMVLLEVTDVDPAKAQALAEAYVANLQRLTAEVGTGEAKAKHAFFDERVKQVKTDLTAAEDHLRDIQKKTGVIEVSLNAQADVGTAAALQGRIAAKEAEIAAMRQYSSEGNLDLKRAQSELGSLQTTAGQLRQPALSGMADKGQEYMRALRDVKYQEALFEALSKQYEITKVDAAPQVSSVQVVDAPNLPDRKSGPKRTMLTLLGAFVGLLASLIAVAVRENRRRAA